MEPHSAGAAATPDDDDDEQEALVPQNHTNGGGSGHHAIEIVGGGVATRRRHAAGDCFPQSLAGKRRLLLLLPVFLLLLVVALIAVLLPLRGIGSVAGPGAGGGGERILEAELRALYLLKIQHLRLLKLWNRTATGYSSAPAAAPASFDHALGNGSVPSSLSPQLSQFRSALLEQIRINRQIQNLLLSSHRWANESFASPDSFDNADADLMIPPFEICGRVPPPSTSRRTIDWNPKDDKFLFTICISGQMTNHLICLEKHLFFAALLDRMLVLPSPDVDYKYDHVLDINHINACLGKKVVVSFTEFSNMKKKRLSIDKFMCYAASPPCFMDEEHLKGLKGLGISLPKLDVAWPEDAKLKEPKKRVAGDIAAKFSSDVEVLAVGDLYFANVEEQWVSQPGGPLAHKCPTIIQPNRLIVLTAQRFVQTFLGRNFVALHFRRHGFLKFCNVNKKDCFFPIPQAAECILRVLERTNAPAVYLSTDAGDSEIKILQSMIVLDGKQIPLIRRPEHSSAEKWDALLYRNHLGGDTQVEAMLDKTISALSTVFIGTKSSTFTEDIIRLRRVWGTASECDEYLCQGEVPNFIAEQD